MDENPYVSPSTTGGGRHRKSLLSTALQVLLVVGLIGVGVCLFLPAVRTARPAGLRNSCQNHMKQISLALLNYEATYHAFPPAYTVDEDGKPLHSWRTLILPYLEWQQLYQTIDLTKPWNDPANTKALNTVVDAYRCPSADGPDNETTYLAVVTPGSCLRPAETREMSDITDRKSETLIVIEVDSDHAVPWMSPRDAEEPTVMDIGQKSNLNHNGGVNAAFVDGHVAFLRDDTTADQRRALISIAGGEKVLLDEAD